LIPVLWIMLVLTLFTAVQRFVAVWRQASTPKAVLTTSRWTARRTSRPTERAWRRRQRTSRR
jgi:hypothetical protein